MYFDFTVGTVRKYADVRDAGTTELAGTDVSVWIQFELIQLRKLNDSIQKEDMRKG